MASVFADTKIFNYWRVRIQLENKLVGGVPKDPKTIEGWLRTKLDTKGNDKEHRLALLSTMQEIGLETSFLYNLPSPVVSASSILGSP